MTTTVECPFCHVDSDPTKTGGFCDDCGRRLPEAAVYVHRTKKVRVLREEGAEPVVRSKTPAADALLTGAVLRLIVGGGLLVIGPLFLREVPKSFVPAVMAATIGMTAVLALAGLAAYRAPLPAALAALGLFVVAWAGLLAVFPAGWPLAVADGVLLVWLIRAVVIARGERHP